MRNIDFYNSVAYRERQAEITRKNWQNGICDFLPKTRENKAWQPIMAKSQNKYRPG
jgi:hypothetical protein